VDLREPAGRLTRRRFGAVIHRFGEVDSTQTVARNLAAAGAPEGTVVTAEHQVSGRGRAGRSWHDRPGESLLFSVVLRPGIEAAAVPQISLLAAVGVAEAVETVTGLAPGIKWPNDLVMDGRKCAGVLAEATSDGAAVARVILGIGINVNQTVFPLELSAGATSLALARGGPVDRWELLAALLARLEARYDAFLDRGFAAVHGEWCRRALTLGRPVLAGEVRGIAEGLDHDGALLVRDAANRVRRVLAGDVREGSALRAADEPPVAGDRRSPSSRTGEVDDAARG